MNKSEDGSRPEQNMSAKYEIFGGHRTHYIDEHLNDTIRQKTAQDKLIWKQLRPISNLETLRLHNYDDYDELDLSIRLVSW